MPTNFWYRIMDGTGQYGPVLSGITVDQLTGSWAVVNGIAPNTAYQLSFESETGPWQDRRTLPSEIVPAGRTPLINTAYGDRETKPPAKFYDSGRAEILDPITHPHIMGYTHRVIQTGVWSDPATWDVGTVPGAGAVVRLTAGMITTIDSRNDAILKDVFVPVGATLRVARGVPTRMRLDYGMTMGLVDFTDPSGVLHEFVHHASELPGPTTRLGWMFMGPTRILGAKKVGHLRTQALSIPAGASSATVPNLSNSGWRAGDVIIFGGMNHTPRVSSDPHYTGPTSYYGANDTSYAQVSLNAGFKINPQDEQRVITGVSGTTLTWDAPLVYEHAGAEGVLDHGQAVSIKPVIANVSRSIRFRSASAEEDGALDPAADITNRRRRAHIMFHRCPDVDVRYFETKNMARTDTDPTLVPSSDDFLPMRVTNGGALLADPDNMFGRYAVHFHWCGGPYITSDMINCIGVTAWAPLGGYPMPGWGITQHGTRMAIEDCVIANVRGAGMVSELGNETGQWVGNVVIGARGDGGKLDYSTRAEKYGNHNGSAGIAFENQSRMILMHGNIAMSARVAYGYWHSKAMSAARGVRDTDARLVDGMFAGRVASNRQGFDEGDVGFNFMQIPPWKDNEAIGCDEGFFVLHRNNGGNTYRHNIPPMALERFKTLNTVTPWNVPNYSSTYFMYDCFFVGPIELVSSNWAVFMGNVTWGWNWTNCLFRNFRGAFNNSGAGLNYDGFFMDIKLENVANFANRVRYTGSGERWDLARAGGQGIMGDWEDDGVGAAYIRNYRNLDSATELPQPYPLAPLGLKLPDGYPPVNPGDVPYFTLGDGTNGAASAGINLTLAAGAGRGAGAVYGILRDSVGDRRIPDHMTSESFPNGVVVTDPMSLSQAHPEDLLKRWGCWNDNGVWKVRAWWPNLDRFSGVRCHFYVDFTLTGFTAETLAAHDLGGPGPEPEWPDELEVVPVNQKPLMPQPMKPLKFLSRQQLEVVSGQQLAHDLRINETGITFSISGGANASLFEIVNQQLRWVDNGSRSTLGSTVVVIRGTDVWGNTFDATHTVVTVSASRVSPSIVDSFDRADENLTANAAYQMLQGAASAFAIRSNYLAVISPVGSPTPVADLGSLGTSEQQVRFSFRNHQSDSRVLFRMVDANNWLGFSRSDGSSSSNYFRLWMCINGVITRLAQYLNNGTQPVLIRVRGQTIHVINDQTNGIQVSQHPRTTDTLLLPLEYDELTAPGVWKLPDTAPLGTKVGLWSTSTATINPWLNDFSATALPS